MKSDQFQVHVAVEDRHWWFVGRRRILLDVISALLPASSDKLVVDVGCGTGANAAAFARRYRCVGIDISDEAIEAARLRFPAVHFISGAAPEGLGDLAMKADAIVLSDVIEHIEDEIAFLGRIVAASKPGAFIVITVPADPRLWTRHDDSFGHYRRYLAATLRETWTGLPVTEVAVVPFNARLYGVIRLIRMLNRRLGRTSGAAGTDFAMPPAPVNAILTRVLAGESRRLVARLRATAPNGHTGGGVSLLAVLRREPGAVIPRSRKLPEAART